jgi:hypothetical protein
VSRQRALRIFHTREAAGYPAVPLPVDQNYYSDDAMDPDRIATVPDRANYTYPHNAFQDQRIIDLWVKKGTPGMRAQYSNKGVYTNSPWASNRGLTDPQQAANAPEFLYATCTWAPKRAGCRSPSAA